MMVCDKCEIKVCHNYCLDPPITFIPENEFFCIYCCAEHNLVNNFIAPKQLPGGFLEPRVIKEIEMVHVETDHSS